MVFGQLTDAHAGKRSAVVADDIDADRDVNVSAKTVELGCHRMRRFEVHRLDLGMPRFGPFGNSIAKGGQMTLRDAAGTVRHLQREAQSLERLTAAGIDPLAAGRGIPFDEHRFTGRRHRRRQFIAQASNCSRFTQIDLDDKINHRVDRASRCGNGCLDHRWRRYFSIDGRFDTLFVVGASSGAAKQHIGMIAREGFFSTPPQLTLLPDIEGIHRGDDHRADCQQADLQVAHGVRRPPRRASWLPRCPPPPRARRPPPAW